MHVQALDARTINALAFISARRYAALVSVSQDSAGVSQDSAGVSQDSAGVSQESVVTAWREMAACHAAACAALERELGERHGLGVSDFEVLERLAESEGRKFRAQGPAGAVQP